MNNPNVHVAFHKQAYQTVFELSKKKKKNLQKNKTKLTLDYFVLSTTLVLVSPHMYLFNL